MYNFIIGLKFCQGHNYFSSKCSSNEYFAFCIFIGYQARYIRLYVRLQPLIYITISNDWKGHSPASSSIVFSYVFTAYQGNFLVLIGGRNMFFLKKCTIDLKCHRYDVTDGDIFNVFFRTKTASETQQIFCNVKHDIKILEVLKSKDMLHNIIVIQVYDHVGQYEAGNLTIYNMASTWITYNITFLFPFRSVDLFTNTINYNLLHSIIDLTDDMGPTYVVWWFLGLVVFNWMNNSTYFISGNTNIFLKMQICFTRILFSLF